jgi:hypothetical protein
MSADTAAGFDGLPASFLKFASTADDSHVLLPLLSLWFARLLDLGQVPTDWKCARISPLFKEGDPADPSKYRMLAVSSVLYRLFANVLRHVLTGWCKEHKAIPDEQFGFYPGRCAQHPMFILRHLVQAQRQAKKLGQAVDSKVFSAFIDFKQAYDHIPRFMLWEHLKERVGLPPLILRAIQGLYESDEYVLVDAGHRATPVRPNKGVKQGCPLSPLLFSLYVNDIGPVCQGGGVRSGTRSITHLMYADDLTLLADNERQLQRMLERLQAYSAQKHLTVNVGKSKVLVFNSTSASRKPRLFYNREMLPVVSEFRFLGAVFNRTAGSRFAAEHCLGSMMGAWREVRRLAWKFGVRDNPMALCHLARTFVLPHAMYASQFWGTAFLSADAVHSAGPQVRMTSFFRQMLGVRFSVPSDVVLHELCQLPLQLYWLRALCRFWNRLDNAGNEMLLHVARADANLNVPTCWSAQLNAALRELLGDDTQQQVKPSLQALETGAICAEWHKRWTDRWLPFSGDPRKPETGSRQRCTYSRWFKQGDGCNMQAMPQYLQSLDISPAVRSHCARFRLGNHGLAIDSGARVGTDFAQRICTRCTQPGQIDDARHLIFECDATAELRADDRFMWSIHNSNGNMGTFMECSCAPLFVHIALTDIDINAEQDAESWE